MNNDAQAVRELAALSDIDTPRPILHYLYVPTKEASDEVARELRSRNFYTEQRLGGDGVNWLVLVRHEAVTTEELMVSVRRSMEELVATVGGEYDGWEADVLQEAPTIR